MASRGAFLDKKYGAYDHRDVPKEDEEMTHIGAGTPAGEYLRRFWQPVAFTDELTDLPKAITILGEELVVFRDFSGNIGVLEAHCPHRGTSLEFGLVSQKGIRCCYHGWLFDVDGAILETPSEPAESTLKDRLCHGAYPVHEYSGIIFAYMGPGDKMPAFPMYDSFSRPGYKLIPGKQYYYPCNWLQILENAMDPVHTAFLHTIVSGSQFTEEFGVVPEIQYVQTPTGMMYVASRRVGDKVWVRMVENIFPNLQQVSPAWEDGKVEHGFDGPMMSRWIVPIDDTHTMFIEFRHVSETEETTPAWWADRDVMLPAQLPVSEIHEERQRQPTDYEAQVTQRAIAIHGLEHLGESDRGVIMFRNIIRQGIQDVRDGKDPEGLSAKAGDFMPTFSNDTVVHAPKAATEEEDRKLLLDIGLRLAEEYIDNPPNLKDQ